jgi:hypothetical protein
MNPKASTDLTALKRIEDRGWRIEDGGSKEKRGVSE